MLWKHLPFWGLMMTVMFSGCATYRTTAVIPEPRPLTRDYKSAATPIQQGKADTSAFSDQNTPEVMTLPQALALALLQNPELAAFSFEIRAAEARALQAGLYPNPEIDVELENFAGSGALSGFGGTETTVSLSQSILLGGKRAKAAEAAALEGDLAAWDYESKRLDVFTNVRRAFLTVLAAQQRVSLNEELTELSDQLLKTITERVEAGKTSPAEISRARVILSATQVELARSRREFIASRQQLAATWGERTANFSRVTGALDTLIRIPSADKLRALLPQNPDLARFAAALKQRQAVIALEDARRIPDPTISGGVRRLSESDDNAFVVGLSIPLPFSDKNQGARQEARIRLAQTLKTKQAVETQLNAALSQAYQRLSSANNETNILKNEILPEARKAYQTINEGYLQGRFDFLDVLDAQRTLFEARGQFLQALTDFHISTTEIERLISQEINTIR